MQNVSIKVEGRKMTIEVDLDAAGTRTGRGNEVVATTNNWTKLPEAGEGFSMNMVVVKKGK